MSEVTVRLTTAADVPLLPEVERSAGESFRALPELKWLADDELTSVADHLEAVAAKCSWVVVVQHTPVGFLLAEAIGGELHVWELAVRQDCQNRGLGRRLMGTAIDAARQHGLRAVTLTTFLEVPWNRPFYERLGFQTLPAGAAGERLEQILRAEAARGLPSRCAMRLALDPPG